MSLTNCSLESPLSPVYDIYCLKKKPFLLSPFPPLSALQPVLFHPPQDDHNPVPSQRDQAHVTVDIRQICTEKVTARLRGVFQGGVTRLKLMPPSRPTAAFPGPRRGSPSLLWAPTHTCVVFSIWPSPLGAVSLSVSMNRWWVPNPALYPWGPPQHLAHSRCSVNLS